MRWLRAAELTCDRAALLVAQDPRVVISALMKLAGGTPAFANELNVDAFLEQVCVGGEGQWGHPTYWEVKCLSKAVCSCSYLLAHNTEVLLDALSLQRANPSAVLNCAHTAACNSARLCRPGCECCALHNSNN